MNSFRIPMAVIAVFFYLCPLMADNNVLSINDSVNKKKRKVVSIKIQSNAVWNYFKKEQLFYYDGKLNYYVGVMGNIYFGKHFGISLGLGYGTKNYSITWYNPFYYDNIDYKQSFFCVPLEFKVILFPRKFPKNEFELTVGGSILFPYKYSSHIKYNYVTNQPTDYDYNDLGWAYFLNGGFAYKRLITRFLSLNIATTFSYKTHFEFRNYLSHINPSYRPFLSKDRISLGIGIGIEFYLARRK